VRTAIISVVAKQKKQHVIPSCYLKAWCDPVVPPGQTAFIWRVPKDGGDPYKRAPEKSFTATDLYTVKMPTGERNLVVENTLAQLESKFVRVRDRIRRREVIGDVDRANLCLFTAAMHARTIRAGQHWHKLQQKYHDRVVAMEQAHGLEPVTSLETASMLENAHQRFLMMSLDNEAPLYFSMNMSVLVTNDPVGFITSDSPCAWYNPKAHTLPPFYRSPGLAQRDIEVTLPLTPQLMLLFSHHTFGPYLDVGEIFVEHANHRVRAFADKEFVSWKGELRPEWFADMPMPDDAWEKTEAGKKAIAEQAE
jgi:Protein of unknown function (DUF4238)